MSNGVLVEAFILYLLIILKVRTYLSYYRHISDDVQQDLLFMTLILIVYKRSELVAL